jgi:hypothetical protein
MSGPAYRVRVQFQWGGGCLWPDDRATADRFGDGPLERRGLRLSATTRERLSRLAAAHDTAWDTGLRHYTPWTPAQIERFNRRVGAAVDEIRTELGPDFEVEYVEQW